MTLAVLSERAEIDAGFLAYIETGKKNPSLATLVKLTAALGLSLREFFDSEALCADSVHEGCARIMRSLCRRLSEQDHADMHEVLKLLDRPGAARAIRVLSRR